MTTILFIAGLIFLAYYMTGQGSKSTKKQKVSFSARPKVQPIDRGEMIRCHQCGCFFSEVRAVHKVIDGHQLQFCTVNCREHFKFP